MVVVETANFLIDCVAARGAKPLAAGNAREGGSMRFDLIAGGR